MCGGRFDISGGDDSLKEEDGVVCHFQEITSCRASWYLNINKKGAIIPSEPSPLMDNIPFTFIQLTRHGEQLNHEGNGD